MTPAILLAVCGWAVSAGAVSSPPMENIEAPALFDGKASRAVIIDTGSDMVAITTKLARALGYDLSTAPRLAVGASSGRTRVPLIRLKSLKVGEVETHDVQAVVMDFQGKGRVSAVIGMNFLSAFVLEVDGAAGRVTITPR